MENVLTYFLGENCDVKKGGEGFQLNVKMMLSVQKKSLVTPHAQALVGYYVIRASVHGYVSESTVVLSAVSPTNTNFRLTFLLTRLQEALYEDLAV